MSLTQRKTAASAVTTPAAAGYQQVQSQQQQPINGFLDGYAPVDVASAWPTIKAAVGLGIAALVVALVAVALGGAALGKETTEVSNRAVRMTLGIASYDSVNNFRTLQEGSQFEIVVDVQVHERQVTLSFPPIQFDSRADYPVLDFATLSVVASNTSEFFVYTVPGTGLPLNIAPKKVLGERFRVQGADDDGSSTFSYIIRADGSLTIADSDGTPLDYAGGHRIGATVISYLLPSVDFNPPQNVRLSPGSSNVIGTSLIRNYFDYYANDIKRDLNTGVIRAAFVWSSNSNETPETRNRLNVWVRTAIVNPSNGQAIYGPAVRVSDAANNTMFAECFVAINPTNVDNLFTTCNFRDQNAHRYRSIGFASFDGGATWTQSQTFADSDFAVDVSATFDDHGNLYVLGISGGDFQFIQARPSIDGGLTFSNTPVINVTAADYLNGAFIDFPKMSIGPDGTGVAGQLALWFCGDNAIFSTPDIRPLIGYVPVTGLGVFGSQVVIRSFSTIPQTTNGIGLSQIHVNPVTGAVYFVSRDINDYQGPGNPLSEETVSMWVNPTGTVNFSNTSFSGKREMGDTNAGINSGLARTTVHLTTWAPNRGANMVGVRPLGFDASRNRLYYISEDIRPALSNDSYIRMTYTENEGRSWSYEYILNDKRGVVTGFPSIAVEHNTGIIAAQWYDPRHDLVNQESVDAYGAIFTAPAARDGAAPAAPVTVPAKKRHSKPSHARSAGKAVASAKKAVISGKVLPPDPHSMTATTAPAVSKQQQQQEDDSENCGCKKRKRNAKKALAAKRIAHLTKAQILERRARRHG